MGVCAGFAWCNPDLNGRTCAVLVCYFTYWWARRGSSPNGEPSLYSVYSKWAESQEKNKTRTPNPGVVSFSFSRDQLQRSHHTAQPTNGYTEEECTALGFTVETDTGDTDEEDDGFGRGVKVGDDLGG